ncbi:MAG: N-acetyltransferase family protein [Tumebacillaceae bacterium]
MVIREARLVDAAGIGRVNVDSWRSSYRGIVPDAFLDEMSYEAMEERWTNILRMEQPPIVFVAEDEVNGTILGYVSGGKGREHVDKYEAELYAIYLRQDAQQKGLGRRLMLALTKKLIEAGMTSMYLWVLAENPSRTFYETLDGHFVAEQTLTIGGVELVEVAYGWEDIRTIH